MSNQTEEEDKYKYSCFTQDQLRQQHYKKEIIKMLIGHKNSSEGEQKNGQKSIEVLKSDSQGVKRDYLLLKLVDFLTCPDLPMKRNLENIIDYTHQRSKTDLSAIFIAVNASDKYLQDFIREILQEQVTQDKVTKLVDIITDHKQSSKGLLIVGNKRVHLRAHETILHSMSEITQMGKLQSFFLPDNFTGTSEQTQIYSAILEDKLLKLIPVDFNRLDNIQEISAHPKPSMSSFMSRLSLRKRANQESLMIDDQSLTESLKKVTQKAPLGSGLTQQLVEEAATKILQSELASQQESELFRKIEDVQAELVLVSDLSNSAYMRQVKRLLTRDCELGNADGKLIATQSL